MTVAELIRILQSMPEELPVKLFDGEMGKHFDIQEVRIIPTWTDDNWTDINSAVVEID